MPLLKFGRMRPIVGRSCHCLACRGDGNQPAARVGCICPKRNYEQTKTRNNQGFPHSDTSFFANAGV